ncbi:flagellar protein FliS [Fodinibius halophilus]|uniref:Flagellar protein FliS n=1 Tax=Fodinibius halophilus TaxID=1736908 RepID=A0A6M1T3Y2_9BACT|nr:flagellar protein FliS [Fodinibius halophilus]NGP87363.1 flagellar protein FliS [Fodinibius halophilus]
MQNPQKVYERQAVLNSSPLRLVVKLYDLVLQATYRKDRERIKEVLSTLIESLNFDHEPADELFELYRYCQDLARQEEFSEIREILEPLRDAWDTAANNEQADPQNANA